MKSFKQHMVSEDAEWSTHLHVHSDSRKSEQNASYKIFKGFAKRGVAKAHPTDKGTGVSFKTKGDADEFHKAHRDAKLGHLITSIDHHEQVAENVDTKLAHQSPHHEAITKHLQASHYGSHKTTRGPADLGGHLDMETHHYEAKPGSQTDHHDPYTGYAKKNPDTARKLGAFKKHMEGQGYKHFAVNHGKQGSSHVFTKGTVPGHKEGPWAPEHSRVDVRTRHGNVESATHRIIHSVETTDEYHKRMGVKEDRRVFHVEVGDLPEGAIADYLKKRRTKKLLATAAKRRVPKPPLAESVNASTWASHFMKKGKPHSPIEGDHAAEFKQAVLNHAKRYPHGLDSDTHARRLVALKKHLNESN